MIESLLERLMNDEEYLLDVVIAKDNNDKPLYGSDSLDKVIKDAPKKAKYVYAVMASNDDGQAYVYSMEKVNKRIVASYFNRITGIDTPVEWDDIEDVVEINP